MARKLKIKSVAGGVEAQEHKNLLLQMGCDTAQGYFIARPMEPASFPDWVHDWGKTL